ncbi:hypothetical protein [Azotosporobacter soli]|uniref:hypothetical protein n=1 Tax=Azotosporobacter soli TaxID=3055040 RepID=UPI0031FE885F
MSFWSMILAFSPWVAFKLLLQLPVQNELLLLKGAIVVAALICAYRAIKGLDKGIIAWGSGLFFLLSLIMVVGLTNIWYMKHLGLFSSGTLAALTWASIVQGKPFTLVYAKQKVAMQYWDSPGFIHKNYKISGAWGVSFSIGLIDAFVRQLYPEMPGYMSEIIDDGAMILAILYTTHLSKAPKEMMRTDSVDA